MKFIHIIIYFISNIRCSIFQNKKGEYFNMKINQVRKILYTIARILGDINAIQKGKVGKRIGRRVAGRATGKALRKLFK